MCFIFEVKWISRAVNGPSYYKWILLAFEYIHLVSHCFSCEFSVVPMFVFNESSVATSSDSLLTYCYIFNFTPWRENFIDLECCCFNRVNFFNWHWNTLYKYCSALLHERSYTSHVVLVRGMSCSTKYISYIIGLTETVLMVWYSVVVFAIYSLWATTPCKIWTEPHCSFLFHRISLSKPRIFIRLALIETGHPLVSVLSISEVLIIPYIVIVVALNVSGVFYCCFVHLFSGWPL